VKGEPEQPDKEFYHGSTPAFVGKTLQLSLNPHGKKPLTIRIVGGLMVFVKPSARKNSKTLPKKINLNTTDNDAKKETHTAYFSYVVYKNWPSPWASIMVFSGSKKILGIHTTLFMALLITT